MLFCGLLLLANEMYVYNHGACVVIVQTQNYSTRVSMGVAQ